MSAQQRWLAQVQAQHPDILTIRDKIISWVETQPAILRQAYNRVLDGGTVQETVELADIYKKVLLLLQSPLLQSYLRRSTRRSKRSSMSKKQ